MVVKRKTPGAGLPFAGRLPVWPPAHADLPDLSQDVELQLIRVVQEALTNVRKHSQSSSAWVAVDLSDSDILISDILITVGDRGKGFDPKVVESSEQAFGVRTMRERIERAGGRLTIESRPGMGTQVKIRVAPGDGGHHDEDSNTSGRRSAPVS